MNDVVSTDQVDSHNSITVVGQYMSDVPRDDAHDADADDEGDGRMTHLVRLHAIQTETYASVAADPSHPPTERVCNKSMTITVNQPTYGRAGAADTARELRYHRPGRVFKDSARATIKTPSAADDTADEVIIGASRFTSLSSATVSARRRAARAESAQTGGHRCHATTSTHNDEGDRLART